MRDFLTAVALSPSIATTSTDKSPESAASLHRSFLQVEPPKDLSQSDLRGMRLIPIGGAIDHDSEILSQETMGSPINELQILIKGISNTFRNKIQK